MIFGHNILTMSDNPVHLAIDLLGGYRRVAEICGVHPRASWAWYKRGKLPRTEATGETTYAEKMAKAHPKISKKKLLSTVYRNGF